MDEIQRVLIKQGRKDLAQKYYKIAQEITNLQKAISESTKTKSQGNLKTAQWRHDFPLDVDSFEVAKVLDSETEKSAFGHIELRRPNSMPITSEYEIPSRKLRIFYEKLEQYIEKEIKKIKVAATKNLKKKTVLDECVEDDLRRHLTKNKSV